MTTIWNAHDTGSNQGLIIAEDTGANIAVSYDLKDAALIAAAPEMLDLLKKCAEALDYVDWLCPTLCGHEARKARIWEAREVIARVTGEA
jgi:hypothetical protein